MCQLINKVKVIFVAATLYFSTEHLCERHGDHNLWKTMKKGRVHFDVKQMFVYILDA